MKITIKKVILRHCILTAKFYVPFLRRCTLRQRSESLSGQGIGHSRWWSLGVPMDSNSENAFPEGIF